MRFLGRKFLEVLFWEAIIFLILKKTFSDNLLMSIKKNMFNKFESNISFPWNYSNRNNLLIAEEKTENSESRIIIYRMAQNI